MSSRSSSLRTTPAGATSTPTTVAAECTGTTLPKASWQPAITGLRGALPGWQIRVGPNPSQWTHVNPAALVERPRQQYDTTLGADVRTSAFARANPSPTWDAVDGAMLHAFAYSTAPTDATRNSERPGNTIQAKLADAGRRPNPAEITEGRR